MIWNLKRRVRLHLLLLLFVGVWSVGWAQSSTPRLLVEPLPPHPLGAPVDVKVSLIGDEDRPLDNNVIQLFVDGDYVRRIRTDEDGAASIRMSRDLSVGRYTLTVVFVGTRDYAPVEVSLPLEVRPLKLSIETVPPLAGVTFALNERRLISDAQGFVHAQLHALGRYELGVLLEPDTLLTPNTKVSFARWSDATFTPMRTLDLRRDRHLQVGFELSHPVTAQFTDLSGEPVGWSRVEALTLKSSAAARRTLASDEPYWLKANRIMRQRDGIYVTPLLWSAESVMVDGSNVINRYQQRFHAEPGATWTINLLLFQAQIRSKDALFGFSVGEGVRLVYPDGDEVTRMFDAENEVEMFNLARGLYKLQVIGATGVAPVTPVAMTKDQEVELKVLSGWDIGAMALLGLFLSFGLLFYGRPHLLRLRSRPLRPAEGGQPRYLGRLETPTTTTGED